MKGIEWLRRFDVDFNILVLLNRRNIEQPEELYEFFVRESFRYLQFIPCVERDPEKGGVADYSITPEQYGRFLCEIFDEWTKEGVPKVYIRELDELLIHYVTGETPSCVFNKECGKYVVVEYNGDIYPCDFFVETEWLLGNITEKPLEEILANEKFLEFKRRKTNLASQCECCRWLRQCHAGCPKHWIHLGLGHNYFCASYRMLFEHSHEKFLELKRFIEQKRASGSGDPAELAGKWKPNGFCDGSVP